MINKSSVSANKKKKKEIDKDSQFEEFQEVNESNQAVRRELLKIPDRISAK